MTISPENFLNSSDAHAVAPVPIIRRISRRFALAPFLKLPITPNQYTTLSLVLGLCAAGLLVFHSWMWNIVAAVLFFTNYILDNCDGEIARAKGLCTTFGKHYDTFVDWLVHSMFFLGLGIGEFLARNESVWLWLGIAAATGGTLNYIIGLIKSRNDFFASEDDDTPGAVVPNGMWERLLYAFRVLSRADFCFFVLALAFIDSLWLLLPATAFGAQVFWITALHRRSKSFHG